jgi:hypothetical protein
LKTHPLQTFIFFLNGRISPISIRSKGYHQDRFPTGSATIAADLSALSKVMTIVLCPNKFLISAMAFLTVGTRSILVNSCFSSLGLESRSTFLTSLIYLLSRSSIFDSAFSLWTRVDPFEFATVRIADDEIAHLALYIIAVFMDISLLEFVHALAAVYHTHDGGSGSFPLVRVDDVSDLSTDKLPF